MIDAACARFALAAVLLGLSTASHSTKTLPGVSFTSPPERAMRSRADETCTSIEQQTAEEAETAALGLVRTAISDLENAPTEARADAPRYGWWFGDHDAVRYETVLEGYRKMHDALASNEVGYDCSCDDPGVFAYVYPLSPIPTIYLCPVFWEVPLLGTDSRAGTIVHELSHRSDVANTNDHQYGQSAAHALAVRDPAKAIDNADNVEYFAENTPELPMSDNDGLPGPISEQADGEPAQEQPEEDEPTAPTPTPEPEPPQPTPVPTSTSAPQPEPEPENPAPQLEPEPEPEPEPDPAPQSEPPVSMPQPVEPSGAPAPAPVESDPLETLEPLPTSVEQERPEPEPVDEPVSVSEPTTDEPAPVGEPLVDDAPEGANGPDSPFSTAGAETQPQVAATGGSSGGGGAAWWLIVLVGAARMHRVAKKLKVPRCPSMQRS